MTIHKGQLIVALDVATLDEAKRLVRALEGIVDIFKVSSQLFTACGPEAVRYLLREGKEAFLDLKFHDIPNTAAAAVAAAVHITEGGRGIMMCTLHALGGPEMLQAAVQAARKEAQVAGVKRPLLVAITVLTSEAKKDNIARLVLERAALAKESGLDGVVASSQEAALIRREFGKDFVIVTPGIRPKDSAVGDQKRVTTPADAIANGSDFLVVGRPVVSAPDPASAAKEILKEIRQVRG
ncbi:MAG: orotidine 5'-phosphate decarboxylase [Omnitrophica WOR_2 bacterium RIFCSPHIGHO2_01_FULL_52_10]|nr:MAG: orotidine 5'-phosphate decarboxylase [Omnitrophica WOR_2 bacterium RIFCSPHIGHO2_01_FULL_52_10]